MAQEILAPLAGKIFKIYIEIGDEVEEDDEAIIIEAMKMETPVFAPCDGTVKEIKVKVNYNTEILRDTFRVTVLRLYYSYNHPSGSNGYDVTLYSVDGSDFVEYKEFRSLITKNPPVLA